MWAHGHFHWNELMTRDVAAAKEFYQHTIGWTFSDMPIGDGAVYTVAMMGDQPVAGLFAMTGPEFAGIPDNWMSYLAVDDVDARVAMAVDAGATLVRPLFDVEGVGRIAVLHQPGGGAVYWMTPAG